MEGVGEGILWGGDVHKLGELRQNPKLSCWGSVSGALLETAVVGNEGGWWAVGKEVVAVVGCCVWSRTKAASFLAESLKPGHWSSVLGAPVETVAEGNDGRWWGCAYEIPMVVGWCVHEMRGKEGAGAKNPTELLGLEFGCAVGNSGERRWWWGGSYEVSVVVGGWVRETRGRGGVGAKNPKPSC